ncbi:hypothetical protein KCP75_20555 [Salmonella enterica subsp. enterica]|nr:hypothetical protein KCP75_20555 [Salmonella enterica subsp. enterica]
MSLGWAVVGITFSVGSVGRFGVFGADGARSGPKLLHCRQQVINTMSGADDRSALPSGDDRSPGVKAFGL